jgi:pimeloyl-ACP methyl ester carboxylesterase
MEGFVHTGDEVMLRYPVHGAGRPVVFVHGWQGAADQWRPDPSRLTAFTSRDTPSIESEGATK